MSRRPMTRTPFLTRFVLLSLASAALSLAAVAAVSAQTWLPPKKTGSFDFIFAKASADRHLFANGINDGGGFRESVNSGFLHLDYGLTDRLAASGDVAYVSSRYVGPPGTSEGSFDDGTFNGALQDIHGEIRYAALQTKRFALTPFAGVVVPSHHYEDVGHASPGKRLLQVPVGFNSGYVWSRPVHTTYVEGRYTHSFLRHEGYNFARSNGAVDIGTYLTSHLSIRAVTGWERTHGGIDWLTADFSQEEIEANHDAQSRTSYWSAGFGVTFEIGPSLGISATYSEILSGENVVDTKLIALTTSWSFGGAPPVKTGRIRREPPQVASLGEGGVIP